jgi:hypothetical protein
VTIGFLVRTLGGSKCLSFKNDGGNCVLGDLQCCRHFLVPFPRSVPQHNPVSELYGQFLRPYGLVLSLTYTVNCGNHVQSIEFTTDGLQSSCRNISRMIKGNRMDLSTILSLIAKLLYTLKTFLKTCFALSLWGIVCRLINLSNNLFCFVIMGYRV